MKLIVLIMSAGLLSFFNMKDWDGEVKKEVSEFYDFDGNLYHSVKIGTQRWLVENFKCTHYKDGTVIPYIPVKADWLAEDGSLGHDGGYCYPDGDSGEVAVRGLLCNWYAVNNVHGLGIVGCHVPSNVEYEILYTFLGGYDVAGGKLKEVGFVNWDSPNTDATDDYGFKGISAGHRTFGDFWSLRMVNEIWTSVEYAADSARWVGLYHNLGSIAVGGIETKEVGYTVRLVVN